MTEVTEDDVKKLREKAARQTALSFLRQIAHNLCLPKGFNGHIDLAFKVDRARIVGETMIQIGNELLGGHIEDSKRTKNENETTRVTNDGGR